MFNMFKLSKITKDNIEEYINRGEVKRIYLISPDFGGSEGIDNQVVVTPKAYDEKQIIDKELYDFLSKGIPVKKLNIDMKYKGNSVVASKIIITGLVDGKPYKRIIKVW